MYEEKFGLTKNPFALTPDASSLYMTEGHREALAGLYYGVMRRRGFGILIGDAGTGKTTLLRKLLGSVPAQTVQYSLISNPALSPTEFLNMVLYKFGLEQFPASKAEGLIKLEALLLAHDKAGKIPVLVVDEAHMLSAELLEEIRLLANFETDDYKLIQIVLAGQPELTGVLNRPELWQLKQRFGVRTTLSPLNQKQIAEYVLHRWLLAGGSMPVPIEEVALPVIAAASRGIPRLVNTICDNALMVAFASRAEAVSRNHVMEAVNDLDLAAVTAPIGINGGPVRNLPGELAVARVASRPVATANKGQAASGWRRWVAR